MVALVLLGLGLGSCSAPKPDSSPPAPLDAAQNTPSGAQSQTAPAEAPATPDRVPPNPPTSPPPGKPNAPRATPVVPVNYPGSKKWGDYADQRTLGPEAVIDTMMRTTTDPLDKVVAFYEGSMPVHLAGTQPDQRILTGSAPGGYLMAVTLKRVKGLTQITVVVSKGKKS